MREEEIRRREAAALRRRVEEAVAAGIDFLDAINGDPDIEDGADDEPSLGTSETYRGFGTNWLHGDGSDREDENEHDEPSLGSPTRPPAARGAIRRLLPPHPSKPPLTPGPAARGGKVQNPHFAVSDWNA